MSVNNLLSRNTAECYVRSLQILDTTNSTDAITGSLIVNGGAIFKKNIFCDGDLDVKKIYADEEIILDIYHVTGTANSTSVSTGAAIIEGGCGIAKDIYVGGSAHILSTVATTSISTGAFVVSGGIGCDSLSSNDINVGDVITVTNNLYTTEIYQTYSQFNIKNNGITAIDSKTQILNTVNSSDSTTGSLHIVGGVGIEKDIFVGGNFNVLSTTNSLNYTNGSIVTAGGLGVTQDVNIHGNLTLDGLFNINTLNITSTLDSISTTSGALIVAGGVGIAKNLYVGGNIHTDATLNVNSLSVIGTTDTTDTLTGALIVSGGVSVAKNTYIGGKLRIIDTTESGGSTIGALVVDGGVSIQKRCVIYSTTNPVSYNGGALNVQGGTGIVKDLYVGGGIYGSNLIYSDLTTNSTNTTTGALQIKGGVGIGKNVYTGGIISILNSGNTTTNGLIVTGGGQFDGTLQALNTLDSTSSTSGCLQVYGGVGIGKGMYVHGKIISGLTTDSTSTSTGSLLIAGGAGIAKKLYCDNYYVHNSNFKTIYDGTSAVAAKTIFGDGSNWKWQIGSNQNGETIQYSFDDTGNFISNISMQTLSVVGNYQVAAMSTMDSDGIGTGAFLTTGGCGIAKNLNVGGSSSHFLNTQDTTSTSTGTLLISGGVGIAKNIYAHDIFLDSNTSISGTFTNFPSATITFYFKRVNSLIYMYTINAIATTSAVTSNDILFSASIPDGFKQAGAVFGVKLIYGQKTNTIANEAILMQLNTDYTIAMAGFVLPMLGNQYIIPPFAIIYA